MVELSVQIESADGLSWDRWKRIVAEVDRLGYRGLYVCDHFLPPSQGIADSIEIVTALTYGLTHSSRLEFGPMVAPVSWRDPVMLVRQAMALDNLSGGRFILGVGAGWMEREHTMFGYELGDKGTRMARLEEAVKVMALLAREEEPVNFDGRFYHLREAKLLPRSTRPGGPRLLIGGSGPKRTLPLTATYADAWNTGGRGSAAFRETSALLDELIVKAGRQASDVKRTLMQQVICYRDEADLGQRLRFQAKQQPGESSRAIFEAMLARQPHLIQGSPEQVVEQIGAYGDVGVEEIMVQQFDLDDMEGLQLIAEQVLPRV